MKISNTSHPASYTARPGDGSSYFYIDSIEINETGVNFTIIEPVEQKEIKTQITDIVCIELLPSLLEGKISCFQALQKLEAHLLKIT